jgi:hypothetical protein
VESEVKERFFVKKRAKNFRTLRGRGGAGDRHALSAHGGHRPRRARVACESFFGSFFTKKELLT